MPKVIKRLEEDIISAIPAILFFMVTFNLVHLSELLALQPGDKQYTGFFGATLGAIIAGKVIILARALPFINAFPKKPLIYNISWKFLIYGSAALLVQILDFFVKRFWHEDFFTALMLTKEAFLSPLCWSIQIWVLMLFFVFVVASEYTRVLGKKEVIRILLGK